MSTACAGGASDLSTAAAGEPAPAGKDLGDCLDVARVRVCWPPDGGAARVRERPVPAAARPAAGWRCDGGGVDRRCYDRARGGGPFVCADGRCEQRYPRMPDDGEWECIELEGIVMCRRGVPPAGVIQGAADVGWRCAPRAKASPPERVCVDYAPDRPDDDARWRCRFEHDHGGRRVCRRAKRAARLLGPCDARRPCPRHLSCEAGACVPPAPAVACWFDDDCGEGVACRLGSCVREEASR